MPRGRQLAPLILDVETREQLLGVSKSTTLPHSVVLRVRTILASTEGLASTGAARRVGTSPQAVGKWRRCFLERGVSGLHDEFRPGRPRTYGDDKVVALIKRALQDKPEGATHCSARTLGQAEGLSRSTVQRWLQLFGVKPNLTKTFKLSGDRFFSERVRDIVGLYLNPPERAVVLCVDEKSQVQALDPTRRSLPMGLGYVEWFTYDYIRHGTTILFAALDVATGKVLARCAKRHRHQEFLTFPRLIDKEVSPGLDIHLIAENYPTHKHAKVKAWLAARPRYHLHFTPTYSSWLNQVERWFGLISQQAIRRGTFTSVTDLIRRIHEFTKAQNAAAKPFVWVATAQSIIDKIERLSTRISE